MRDAATASEDESSRPASTSSGNEMTDFNIKCLKAMEARNEIDDSKAEMEASSCTGNQQFVQSSLPLETPKQDYIHVRASRGQANDNHSLAERFLSMELEAVHSRMNSSMEGYSAKDGSSSRHAGNDQTSPSPPSSANGHKQEKYDDAITPEGPPEPTTPSPRTLRKGHKCGCSSVFKFIKSPRKDN
ncbi:hypothetical protein MRB53_017509 [Persea americana]|uniref:Uncharacterized protein n=1 Tax=Persea americana TaxID=3435 RepID=A0ACC2M5B7_PERAE|nr:hypothetical protein MRB53_017509 [Persea americana]